jgi:hypothetical protein
MEEFIKKVFLEIPFLLHLFNKVYDNVYFTRFDVLIIVLMCKKILRL